MTDFEDTFLSGISQFSEDYTPDQRRKIIGFTVSQLIFQGYSQASALALYRDKGVGINSSDFRQIYNKHKENDPYFSKVSILSPSDKISEDMLNPTTWNITGKYRFTAFITYRNAISGLIEHTPFYYDTNKLYSVQSLLNRISAVFGARGEGSGGTVEDIILLNGMVQA